MKRSCSGTNRAGNPCQAPPLHDRDVCRAHAGLLGGAGTGGGRKKQISDAQMLAQEIRERFTELLAVAFTLALQGDIRALKLLFEYGFGRPRQSVELSGPNGGAITIAQLAQLAAEESPTEE